MIWLTILKHIIPYIWDVFIKKYDEDGNPVLWSKTMILGVVVIVIVIYSNLYSFIHTNTEAEHTLNVKNTALIDELQSKVEEFEKIVVELTAERDSARHELLQTKAVLSETRLDHIQMQNKLNDCQTATRAPMRQTTGKGDNKSKLQSDLDTILRGK